jgi:Transcriptional regulators
MQKKVTMQDIADKLGITKVSVSKVLNNQPGIGENLRLQILKTAKEMNYTKHKEKSALRKTYNFAIVCPKRNFLDDEYFYTNIYFYINRYCIENHHGCDCYVITREDEDKGRLPEQLSDKKYNGIFIAGECTANFLSSLSALKNNIVAIDFYNNNFNFDYVVVDNFLAGQYVTKYLLEKGHREIGFIGDYKTTSSISDRYFGYMKTMLRNELVPRAEAQFSVLDVSVGATVPFKLPEKMPTAFICHCDKAAFIIIQALERAGFAVPSDVSVMSFDNTKICEIITPKLTTIDINLKEISKLAIDLMLKRLKDHTKKKRKFYLETSIIERDSVTNAPAEEE